MAMYCFCHCFLYPRTESIIKYGAVRKFYPSAVTYTIISCCIRSRRRGPSLESKPIASTVCCCPISTLSISSEPNSLKEDLTARKVHLYQTNWLASDLTPCGNLNQRKSCVEGHQLSIHLSLPTSKSTGRHTGKISVFSSSLKIPPSISYDDFQIKFTYTKLIYVLISFRWRRGSCALF